ncbi:hypothetical protein LY11_03514 [Pedobacter cryoconitis]|uniref:Uncharacterized protein n=1 Tax=Pedobacter cryoconitis TaxID=188932 RepID=A0A327SHY2_9SPHI|nr:hypothetical protein LY11_03514 [Pedobacter cryoconitis]
MIRLLIYGNYSFAALKRVGFDYYLKFDHQTNRLELIIQDNAKTDPLYKR